MNKVILITGAGAGVGQAIALKYFKMNAQLSLADINIKGLEETVQIFSERNNDKVLQTAVDLSKDEDVKNLVNKTIQKFGKIDILINCAGIIRQSGITDDNIMEVYDKVLSVNLRSVVHLSNLCSPYLIKSKGCIINIASALAIITTDNYLAYSISKAGLDHFTRCCALELAAYGIRVNAVLPGVVNTKLYTNSGMTEDESKNFLNSVVPKTPLKHVIEPNEVANLVVFLSSEKARSITGVSYVIDAGTALTGYKDS